MSRRRITDQSEEIIDVDYEDKSKIQGDIDEQEAQIEEEFDASKDEVTWLIKIYRVVEGTANMNWLFNCNVDELKGGLSGKKSVIERLRDDYGTGIYRARVYKNRQLYRTLTYPIEAPKLPEPVQIPSEITAIQATMQQQNEMLSGLIERITTSPMQQNQGSMIEMMQGMTTIMLQMKELSNNNQPQNNIGVDDMIKLISLGAEVKEGTGETGIMDIVKSFIQSPIAEKVIEAAENPAEIPQHAMPQGQPATQVINQNPQVKQQMDPIVGLIQVYILPLISKAKKGSDPALYADVILDNVDDKNFLLMVVNNPSIEQVLCSYHPEIKQYWPWFAQVIDEIKHALTEQSDQVYTETNVPGRQPHPAQGIVDPQGKSGDASDPQINVGFSATGAKEYSDQGEGPGTDEIS